MLTIDDLFTPAETSAPDRLSGNDEHIKDDMWWTSDYPNWVVDNVLAGYTLSLDISFKKRTPCDDITESPQMYKFISDYICCMLNAADITHSNVCFDIQNFRTHKSLDVRVFVKLPESTYVFTQVFYKMFLFFGHICNRLEAYAKISGSKYQKEYTKDGLNVELKKIHLDRMNEICKFVQWIESYYKMDGRLNAIKHYSQYLQLKMRTSGYNAIIYNHTNSQTQYVEEFIDDICTLTEIIREELSNLIGFNVSDSDIGEMERYFISEPYRIMKWIRKFYDRAAYVTKRPITEAFTIKSNKVLKEKCENSLRDFYYFKMR